ncbi:MAG: energy-coupled thiamine transporter ThiT [Eubacteriales bacterium]|nr:energy-coupled thiamine transporter ThiT [Eubacteriales bacterium]
MKKKQNQTILALVEGAAMAALAVVLQLVMSFIPGQPQGGSISIAIIPIIYYAYRRGTGWGLLAGIVWSATELLIGGFYAPPAGTFFSVVLCLLLDYIIAFGVAGIAPLFAKPFGERRILGYTVGAVAVSVIRYISSFLSGVLLWGSYAPEDMNVWLYSLTYNGAYMIPNIILAGVLIIPLCLAVDPKTLKPYKRTK